MQISSDPYTNSTSQHKTMVEPDTYSFGSTIVSAIQSGRFTDGGASNIGWATSTNGGSSWTNGFLPGTTVFATPAGPYDRVSDPTVAYDAAHNTWLIASLAISTSGGSVLGAAVIVNQSTNGGTSWSSTTTVASIQSHTDAGGIRSGPLPTAEIDGAGKVFVVWADCRFETSCRANDMVMSTSSNGTSWSAVTRIPADAVGSGVDHFIAGLAVDKSTSGSTSHLVLAYYYYPVSSCSSSTCKLDIGYSSSTNGGSSWSATTNITGPMTLSWLANTTQGRMVGDYMSTSFNVRGKARVGCC